MISIHPVSLAVAVFWTSCVGIAYYCRDLSASAGKLPGPWVSVAMIAALVNVALVVAGVWFLPERVPRIVVRLVQLVGMAGAFWSAGTLIRALYALTV